MEQINRSHKGEANINDYEYFHCHWTFNKKDRENNYYNLALQCAKIIEKTLKRQQSQ